MEICGTINTPAGCDCAVANISITDTTDGPQKAKPVHTQIEKWQIKYSHIFCCIAQLGRLPEQVTTLSDWMTVARIPADCLVFPHKGKRNLQFTTSILSGQNGTELACTSCNFTYENPSLGYIELEENIRRAKAMAVPLAFAVAAADKKISDNEIKVIQNWAKNNIAASNKLRCKFNKLFGHAVAFFPNYNRIYSRTICKKIAETVPVKVRCDILDFYLRIAGANRTIAARQLILLKNIADWLGIHREKFRSMAENILPVSIYEVEDMEISLGIASDMDPDQICRQLSKEYRKWNARVTNRNPEIETRAKHMLKFIAETRNQYAG